MTEIKGCINRAIDTLVKLSWDDRSPDAIAVSKAAIELRAFRDTLPKTKSVDAFIEAGELVMEAIDE